MNLIFFGPPGVGKGTHGEIVSKKFGIPKISTGDLLRDEVKTGSDLGGKIKELIDAGKYVPDEIVLEILKQRLSKEDCIKGFILDGFPRTLGQAEALDGITKIDKVVNFNLSHESILDRLTGRWTCKNCQAIYHEKHLKPKIEGKCDKCDSQLYQREDQQTDVIKKRLEVYEKETKPLIEFYKQKGCLVDVYCEGEVGEVSKRVLAAIGEQAKRDDTGLQTSVQKNLASPLERTLVVIKPDGVQRNLIGEIISRFEKAGLRVVASKMVKVKKGFAKKHYTDSEEQVAGMGNKTLQASRENNVYDQMIKIFKSEDPKVIGTILRNAMVKFITSGPVFATILQGPDAVKLVRKITGYTDPSKAEKGTIRGDLGQDSIIQANMEKRATKNLVHASGTPEEAEKEIALWFKPKEIVS